MYLYVLQRVYIYARELCKCARMNVCAREREECGMGWRIGEGGGAGPSKEREIVESEKRLEKPFSIDRGLASSFVLAFLGDVLRTRLPVVFFSTSVSARFRYLKVDERGVAGLRVGVVAGGGR
jgi:hypothetical protein